MLKGERKKEKKGEIDNGTTHGWTDGRDAIEKGKKGTHRMDG